MYYHGIDAKTRSIIERAHQERGKVIAAFWARLFSSFARKAPGHAAKA